MDVTTLRSSGAVRGRFDLSSAARPARRRIRDEVFGFVAAIFKHHGPWEQLEFADFAQYCEERLGMARRTVLQRVALERGLRRIPLLRQALREKRISYEKARPIARHWEARQVTEVRPLIAIAERMTCVDFREALTAK
jgi:hypothetical protein